MLLADFYLLQILTIIKYKIMLEDVTRVKQITTGILAHVDAGKTTLSEALLYQAGNLRKLGRVDNGDSFLDPDNLEKSRGITIFSHEAQVKLSDFKMTLLDTPGHVDFASQTENVLTVVDYAILVVSAPDGVDAYTQILWNMLKNKQIPVFIFVNKMDSPGVNRVKVLKNIQQNLDRNCLEFDEENSNWEENIAACDEEAFNEYLKNNQLKVLTIQKLIQKQQVYPVYFGSALNLTGIEEFLNGIKKWSLENKLDNDFNARVFKISHDEKGERLTWLRVLGGSLKNKTELFPGQKINQIRDYDGSKFTLLSEISPGKIGVVTGLKTTYPGQGINLVDAKDTLRPVLTYRLNPLEEDIYTCLDAMKILQDENPELGMHWSEHLQEITIQVMGKIQLEILEQILQERFGLKIKFDQGNILYKETISQKIEAVGHFEPLRHYSEVHFLLKPLPRNSGVVIDNQCSLEVLSKNWQHQIITALKAKEHLGVLTGSPLTDVKITLISGKASNVHTVGGDFREAASRGVRQGLMELRARNAIELLEPWYKFKLMVPNDQVGRAMNDIQKMSGSFEEPIIQGETTLLNGKAPVSEMMDYTSSVRGYSHGQGRLECVFAGYGKCHNSQAVVEARNYDPMNDSENTPNSVFCSHGAGHTVTWDKVPDFAQYPYQLK